MRGQLLDGNATAAHLRRDIKLKIKAMKANQIPGLAVILVGEDPASKIYVRNKRLACQEVGIHSFAYDLPYSTQTQTLLALIEQLNTDPRVHGILVQLPLPSHIDKEGILEKIDPRKDVDGFHPYNLGRLAQKQPLIRPCTPYGIMQLLNYYKIQCLGLNAAVIGASTIVGLPMTLELLLANATVSICHSHTQDLSQFISQADLLISAIGKPGIIQTQWIKENAIVIDVGMNRLENGQLVGDIDFHSAKKKSSWITPVPGGVGPMTVAALLQNTLLCSQLIETHHV